MNRRGFTLVEIIVVIAIIVVVAAITFPVFSKAKRESSKASCTSNLRQIFVALALYRDAVEGTDAPGRSHEMGMPPMFVPPWLEPVIGKASQASLLVCNAGGGFPDGASLSSYGTIWPAPPGLGQTPEELEADQQEWIAYVTQMGMGSVVFVDPNHQSHWPASSLSQQSALGLTLGGSVLRKTRLGSCIRRQWWMNNGD